jgi:hypothetical protein
VNNVNLHRQKIGGINESSIIGEMEAKTGKGRASKWIIDDVPTGRMHPELAKLVRCGKQQV